MADLSHLSDQQLDQMIAQHQATPVAMGPDLSKISDQDLDQMIAKQQAAQAPQKSSWLDDSIMGVTPRGVILGAAKDAPLIGGVIGGIAGGIGGTAVAPGVGTAAGGVAGAAAGGVAGKSLENTIESALGQGPQTRKQMYAGLGNAGLNMAEAEMGGQAAGAGLKLASETPAGQYAIQKASNAADSLKGIPKWLAQKFAKIVANVPEETTARYLENPDVINNAPTREDISNRLLDLKNQADDHLNEAQDNLVQARENLRDHNTDVRNSLQDQKYDARQKLNEAQQNFNEKKQAFKEALKSNHLTSMAHDVTGAISDLKDQVVQGSKDAYDTLFKANGAVQTKPLQNVLQSHIDSMMINGVPASRSAEQAIGELRAMQDRLGQFGDELTMPQAKQVLQGLDKDIQYSKSAGSFTPQADQALSDMRSYLDQDVKTQVPEYKAKMADVSRKTRLLKSANDLYGDPASAINNLNGITSERGQAINVPILEALGQETGKDLSTPVNHYLMNHKIMTTPSLFDQTVENIPEAKSLNAAKNSLNEVSNPEFSRSAGEKEGSVLRNKIKQSEVDVKTARGDKKLFNGVTPDSVTGKTKALNGANQYGAEQRFGNIDQRYGTNFQNEIQARNDRDAFNKDTTNGSRKSVLGAIGGFGAGSVIGHPILGAEAGGAIGGVLDKYAGPTVKGALDLGIGTANAAKGVGSAIGKGIESSPLLGGKAIDSILPSPTSMLQKAASNPQKGPTKWANDGFQKLQTHAQKQSDKSLNGMKGALLSDPKTKQLLIAASDLKPGSPAMAKILTRVKNRLSKENK